MPDSLALVSIEHSSIAFPDALVNAPTLLDTEFHPNARPSLRWLREQTRRRTIPFLKISGKIFFRPADVRAALEKKFTITSR
jgi:hypothetical protein